jgi:hypothetical protein
MFLLLAEMVVGTYFMILIVPLFINSILIAFDKSLPEQLKNAALFIVIERLPFIIMIMITFIFIHNWRISI